MRICTTLAIAAVALVWVSAPASAKTEPDKGCPTSPQPVPVPYPKPTARNQAAAPAGCPAAQPDKGAANRTMPIGTVKGGGTIKASHGDEAGVLK